MPISKSYDSNFELVLVVRRYLIYGNNTRRTRCEFRAVVAVSTSVAVELVQDAFAFAALV